MKTAEQKAVDYFSRFKTKKEVFGTSDNFLFERKQDALAHSATLEIKGVETFENSEPEAQKETKEPGILELSIGKLKEALQAVEDKPLVEALLLQEQQDANRKGAVEAIEDRLKELKENKD